MIRRIISGVLLTLAVAMVENAPVYAKNLPQEDELKKLVATELPAYWVVSSFSPGKPKKAPGTGASRYVIEFSADFSTAEVLYEGVNKAGPFILAIRTIDADQVVHVTGLLDLSEEKDGWHSGLDMSVNLAAFGRPLNSFDGPALELGSAAAKDALKSMSETELAERRIELKKKTARELEAVVDEGEARIKSEKERIQSELRDEQAKGAQELLELIAQHKTTQGAIVAQQKQEISELKAGLAAERRSLQRQVENATDVVALQERLKNLQVAINGNDAKILENFRSLRETRLAFFEAIPKSWHGQIICADRKDPKQNFSNRLELLLDTPLPNGYVASLWVNRTQYSHAAQTEIVFSGDAPVFPMTLMFVSPGLKGRQELVPSSFQLVMQPDGRMAGVEGMRAVVNGQEKEFACSISLSG